MTSTDPDQDQAPGSVAAGGAGASPGRRTRAGDTRAATKFAPGKRSRPQTTGEEIANSITHGLGAVFGMAALLAMVYVAIIGSRSLVLIVSLAVYGTSLFLLYMASTLYHALTHRTAKRVFQILDHSSIYLLIAGTYTPFCLVAVQGWAGIALFLVEWTLAVIGIVFEAVWHSRPGWLTAIVYIAMGWLALFVIGPVAAALPPAGIRLLVAGGLAYTVGVIFYAMRNVPYMHSVWHLFVLVGSILHFLAVLLYIIPMG
jgi:hemolysin III